MKKLLLITALLFFSSSWSIAQTDNSVKPPSGMKAIQAYSIFLENYRSDSYENAIKFGRWMWEGMPETIEGYPKFDLKRNLDRLVSVYNGMAQEVQDPSLKEAYADTALLIFDRMFENYPDDKDSHYDWYIERGRLYQTHSGLLKDASKKAADDYYQAFQIKPEEFTKYGDGYYMQVMLQEMVGAGEKDRALAIIKKAEPYAPSKLQSYFDNVRNKLFDSPEERIAFLEGQLKDEPKNPELLNQLRELYQGQDMVDKAQDVSKKLYNLDPNYENTMALADAAISNANYNNAEKYLKEAVDKASSNKQKARAALKLSNTYLNQEQLQSARRYARQASNYDSDWGAPYIQIADIYAQAVSQCTSDRKMDRKDKVVYWLVLDYLDKAKRVDPSTTSEVQRKYNSYEPVTPTTEEKFFWQPPLKKGDKMKVDGSLMSCYEWVNETTTVR